MKSDLEIIQDILDGETEAYDEIINRYQNPIYKFLCNSIKNEDLAKDLTQEVFINCYYKLYTYDKKFKFSTWLFQIAVNKSIDYMRKSKKRQEVDISGLEVCDKSFTPESFVEYAETKSSIEKFIKTLSKTEQQILALRYSYNELTFSDISEILKINESTVKYKYYNIYKKFNKYCDAEKGVESCYEL